jgi:Family of unknown function (DUF5947)
VTDPGGTSRTEPGTGGSLGVLGRFRAQPSRPVPGERCEMCAVAIGDEHAHVVNIEVRNLLCTCRACYLLFTRPGAAQSRYRAVPDRYLHLPAFALSAVAWDSLQIPVRMAFFFANSSLGRVVAFYPSPAGATESLLPLESWQALVDRNPVLATLEPDVEALLVHGPRGAESFDCFVVPIDACYELTGIVRRRWKGFDGGEEAWRDIGDFFARLRARSRAPSPEATG